MRVDMIHSHLHQDDSSRTRPTRAERGAQDLREDHWLICPADTLNSKSSSTGRRLATRFSVDPALPPAAWRTRTIDFDSRHNAIDSGVRTPGDRPGPGRCRILPVSSWITLLPQAPGDHR